MPWNGGRADIGLLMADPSGENPRFLNSPDICERRLSQHARQFMVGGACARRWTPQAEILCLIQKISQRRHVDKPDSR
jgi:hypothetical protein